VKIVGKGANEALADMQCGVRFQNGSASAGGESTPVGKMTAHQMVCHLGDSFRGVIGEKALAGRAEPWAD